MKRVLLILLLSPFSLWATEFSQCKHLLARTVFGIDRAHLDSCLRSTNYTSYVQTLIYKTHTSKPEETVIYTPNILKPSRKIKDLNSTERKAFRIKRRKSYMVLKEWWFTKMLTTDDPFWEHMVLFWHNHFTSSLRKVGHASLLYKQNALFRKHAMGNFDELLHAIVKDPAMLSYLDNRGNKKNHPNENLARELLELFTMGEGHYNETDIQALAKALTGYSVDKNLNFRFKRRIHDNSSKEIFGEKGNFNADDMIDIILAQPATSKFIVKKLWLEFIGATPDPVLVKKLALLFTRNNYEIKPLLEAILMSKPFIDPSCYGTMVKSPVDLVIGTLRSFEYRDFDAKTGIQYTRKLGQDLFDPPNVKGWSGGENWINTHTLLLRKAFLNRLLRGDSMRHLQYTLFSICPTVKQREICAAKILLPVNVFLTPAHTFKQTLHTILQQPLYQLK